MIPRPVRGLGRRMIGPAPPPAPPLSQTISFEDPEVAADPFPWYEKLRPEGPVVHLPRHDAWMALGFDAAREALSNWDDFSSAPWAAIDPVLLGADPPVHGAARRVVSRRFGGEALRRLEAGARELGARLVRPGFDAVGGYAKPLSRQVAAELIGFPSALLPALEEAEAGLGEAGGFERLLEALGRVAHEANAYRQFVEEGAGAVGPGEARSLVRLLWVASTATTERAIAHCILRLAEDPEAQERLRVEPGLVPRFVDEIVRLFPPEMILRRVARRDCTLAGTAIPGGAQILIALAPANRDPAIHRAPAEIAWTGEAPSLAFGVGPHTCVGGPLSRRIVVAAVETLLSASRSVALAVPRDEVRFVQAMVVLAPRSLPIRVEPV